MRRSLILAGLALGVPAGAAPRPGRVVRVERHVFGAPGLPRLCSVSVDAGAAAGNISGFCMMAKPAPGEKMTVLDSSRAVATVRVTNATPYNDCNPDTYVWMITGTIERGDLAGAQGPTWGVIDVPLDPRTSHLVTVAADHSPTGHTSGDQIEAIDTDGDGAPDYEFISFACDELGNPSAQASGSCLEVWVAERRGFTRVHQTRSRTCY